MWNPVMRKLRAETTDKKTLYSRLAGYIGRLFIPKHFPIAYKLATIMTLLISSSMIMLGTVIVNNQTHLLQRQMDRFADTVIEQFSNNSKELVMSDDILSLMLILNNLNNQDNILSTVVFSDEGKIISSAGYISKQTNIDLYEKYEKSGNAKINFNLHWESKNNSGEMIEVSSYIRPINFKNVVAGHALITFSTEEINETITEMINAIIIATILMIILGIFVSLHMGRRISKPINNLMDASIEISKGNYQYQIEGKRNDELGNLTTAVNSMADGLYEKTQVESALSKYVSKNIANEVMGNLTNIQLGGQHVEASVIFADIVGFTELSENYPAEKIAGILNDYFSYIALACELYQGTIDKYMGDCAMIVFGVPNKDESHKLHAIYCAIMIQKLVQRINQIRMNSQQLAISFRISVNSGKMLAGNLGSDDRMQYTVVGESVNLASRLQTVAEKNKIIVTREFYQDPDIQWRLIAKKYKSIKLKGIKEEVSTYLISDTIALYQDKINEQIDEILKIKPALI